jgi:hypothetical protein
MNCMRSVVARKASTRKTGRGQKRKFSGGINGEKPLRTLASKGE